MIVSTTIDHANVTELRQWLADWPSADLILVSARGCCGGRFPCARGVRNWELRRPLEE
jgi:hypothetical protein